MSKRLNARLRVQIVDSVVSTTLKERREEVRARKIKLGEAVLADVLGQWSDIFHKLPARLLPESAHVNINLAGKRVGLPLDATKPVPANIYPNGYHTVSVAYDARHTFNKTFEGIWQTEQSIKADDDDLSGKLTQVVGSVSTVKALLDIWPDLEPMLPSACFEEKTQVPAVLVDDVKANLERARKG